MSAKQPWVIDNGPEITVETLAACIREAATSPQEAAAIGSPARVPRHDPLSAFAAQAELNRLVAEALPPMVDYLRDVQRHLATIEAASRAEAIRLQEAFARQLSELAESSRAEFEKTGIELENLRHDLLAGQTIAVQTSGNLEDLETRLAATEERWREMTTAQEHLRRALEARQEAGEQHHTTLLTMIDEARGRLDSLAGQTSSLRTRIGSDLDEMRMRVLRADRAVRTLRETFLTAGRQGPAVVSEMGTPERLTEAVIDEKFDYFMFEQRFRGDVTLIKQRQEAYLEFFRGKQNVIDLGCGRGEFVELLTEHGIQATGIDMNEDMIDFCRDRGINVVQANLFDYLEGIADRSIDGIFAAQVVEHLTPQQIMGFIGLCGSKLKSAGVVVAETVNANCPYALGNFYLDPTHVKPVPFGLLRFMFEQEAFDIREIRFSGPVPGTELDSILRASDGVPTSCVSYQDYAVIAVRP